MCAKVSITFFLVEIFFQSLVSDPDHTYLSVSTPILSQAFLISTRLSHYTIEKVKAISAEVVEIVQPPKEGYQLTLRLNFARMSHGKGLELLALPPLFFLLYSTLQQCS